MLVDDVWGDHMVEAYSGLTTAFYVGFKLTLYGCVVYVCCVGFASLDVVCDEFNDCIRNPGL